MNIVSFTEMVTSWGGISILLYLLPSTQYFIEFINMLHVPSYEPPSGYITAQITSKNGSEHLAFAGVTDSKYSLS